jgi:hypothetical protein
VIGIALGQFCLAPFQAIARAEVAQIHLPVAVLIWLMVIPMLMKNDFGALSTPTEFFREVECAPWDEQYQAADLTVCRVWWCSNCDGPRYPSAECGCCRPDR